MSCVKVAHWKTPDAVRDRLKQLGVAIPLDDRILTRSEGSPLSNPLKIGPHTVGNRWCIHPMEGWDAEPDGSPSELTLRRWRHFGLSGAKLIWGGEAAAVSAEGRANPNQLLATSGNEDGLRRLLREARQAHLEEFDTIDDFLIGLQLTHSGRFCRPHSKSLEPRIAYHHPLLDEKFGIDPNDDTVVWTDDQLDGLIDNYVNSARLAFEAGYQFVDIKACHGYLLHEFLSARVRKGPFGGDFDGRTRLLTTIIDRVRSACPELTILVRLSIFDTLPYQTSREIGRPMDFQRLLPYQHGFGILAEDPFQVDLREPLSLIQLLADRGVAAINLSCGSPYYNPHIQRPASFRPSDGYLPPEDPLIGVARQIEVARQCQQAFPEMPMVGTGYSYLQDYVPHVAQAVVRQGWIAMVGLGRMVLSYPQLPAHSLESGSLRRKRVCRTFSDCTTAPRGGLVSGCYPLDDHYKQLPAAAELRRLKREMRGDEASDQ